MNGLSGSALERLGEHGAEGEGFEAWAPWTLVLGLLLGMAVWGRSWPGWEVATGYAGVWLAGLVALRWRGSVTRRERAVWRGRFEELRDSEDRFRRVVESSLDGFWLVDERGRILEVNDSYVRHSGYTRPELLTFRVGDLDVAETPELAAERSRKVREEGACRFETAHRRKDGSIWPVEVKVAALGAGRKLYAGFFRDLSAQHQSDALLRSRAELSGMAPSASVEQLLQAGVDHAERMTASELGFLHLLDPRRGQVSVRAWSGRSQRRWSDGGWERHLHEWDRAALMLCAEDGKAGSMVLRNEGPDRGGVPGFVGRTMVIPVRRGNDVVAVLGLANKARPYQEADLEVAAALASMVADDALRRLAQQDLEHFFDLAPGLVCIVGFDGRIRRVNHAWQSLLGVPESEDPARGFLAQVHPEDRRATRLEFLRLCRRRPAQRFTNRCRAVDGTYRWIEWNASALVDESLVFAAAQDITERRRSEELMRLQAQLGLASSSGSDRMFLLQLCLRVAVQASGLECGGLYLRDADGGLDLVAHTGLSEAFVDAVGHYGPDSPRAAMVHSGTPFLGTLADLPLLAKGPAREEGLRALALLPIHHQGEALGCLNLASKRIDVPAAWARRHIETVLTQIGSIVARLMAEEQLRESEKRLRLLFESAHDAIFWADADSGVLLECNQAAERLTGSSRVELLGRHHTCLHPPSLREEISQAFRSQGRHEGQRPVESEVLHRDGSRRQVVVATSVIPWGSRRILQGIFHDLTEARSSELNLRRHQVPLEAIYENAPFRICLLDERGRMEAVNRRGSGGASSRPGPPAEAGLGHVAGCLHAGDSEGACGRAAACASCALHLAIQETTRTGVPRRRLEFRVPQDPAAGGVATEWSISMALVPVEGRTRLLLCLEDVTHVKQLEHQFLQTQKLEALGRLAGGVAHDFNNILAVLIMHLHLLKDLPGLEAEALSSVHEMSLEAERAAALTRQLLLFGRRQPARIQPLNLNTLVEGLLKMLRRLLGEHIGIEFDPSLQPAWVAGDAGMLEQVVVNLCVNARDAMPKGGGLKLGLAAVQVTASMARNSTDARVGDFMVLTVSDEGTGIAAEHLPHVFEPFFTTKPAGKGTGLGLSLVHGITHQHHGWVEVASAPGMGTTFRVYVPASAEAGAAERPVVAAALPRGHEHILLVEDDPSLRRTTSRLLRAIGYQVTEAENGSQALRQWDSAPQAFHLVLSDVVMPGGLSGLELVEQLRRRQPTVRVLLSSGYSQELSGFGGGQGQEHRVLPKPCPPEQLAEAIRRTLDDGPALPSGRL